MPNESDSEHSQARAPRSRGRGRRSHHGRRPRAISPPATIPSNTPQQPAELAKPPRARESRSPLEQAIALITQVLQELRQVIDHMELAVEYLEEAERLKISDEKQILELEKALRRLRHSPPDGRRAEEPAHAA